MLTAPVETLVSTSVLHLQTFKPNAGWAVEFSIEKSTRRAATRKSRATALVKKDGPRGGLRDGGPK